MLLRAVDACDLQSRDRLEVESFERGDRDTVRFFTRGTTQARYTNSATSPPRVDLREDMTFQRVELGRVSTKARLTDQYPIEQPLKLDRSLFRVAERSYVRAPAGKLLFAKALLDGPCQPRLPRIPSFESVSTADQISNFFELRIGELAARRRNDPRNASTAHEFVSASKFGWKYFRTSMRSKTRRELGDFSKTAMISSTIRVTRSFRS